MIAKKHIKLVVLLTLLLNSLVALSAPEYVTFKNWSEAARYFSHEIEPVAAKLRQRDEYDILPQRDRAYKRVDKIMTKLFKEFKKTYRSHQFPVKKPHVILVKSDPSDANAGVYFDVEKGKKAYLFYIYTPLLQKDDKTLTSVMAHELVHLLMQWHEDGKAIPAAKFYKKSSGNFLFGHNIFNDFHLEKNVPKILSLRQYTGDYINPELGNIPFSTDSRKFGPFKELNELFYKVENVGSRSCQDATSTKWDLHYKIIFDTDKDGSKLIFKSEEKRKEIKKLSKTLETQMKKCFKGITYPRLDYVSEVYGFELSLLENIVAGLTGFHKDYYDIVEKSFAKYDVAEALFNIQKILGEEKRVLEQSINIPEVRIYNHEDHADEFALRILKRLNIEPKSLNRFLLGPIPVNCNYQKLDQSDIEKLSFGDLKNKHHDSCWRSFRNQSFYNSLR